MSMVTPPLMLALPAQHVLFSTDRKLVLGKSFHAYDQHQQKLQKMYMKKKISYPQTNYDYNNEKEPRRAETDAIEQVKCKHDEENQS
jgi:xanthine dehydrogenase iron-sulfur cluster and FAD-binding subunit A